MKINSDAKIMRAFLKFADPKIVLDSYQECTQIRRYGKDLEVYMSAMFQQKFSDDINRLTQTRDPNLESFAKHLFKASIREHKHLP